MEVSVLGLRLVILLPGTGQLNHFPSSPTSHGRVPTKQRETHHKQRVTPPALLPSAMVWSCMGRFSPCMTIMVHTCLYFQLNIHICPHLLPLLFKAFVFSFHFIRASSFPPCSSCGSVVPEFLVYIIKPF